MTLFAEIKEEALSKSSDDTDMKVWCEDQWSGGVVKKSNIEDIKARRDTLNDVFNALNRKYMMFTRKQVVENGSALEFEMSFDRIKPFLSEEHIRRVTRKSLEGEVTTFLVYEFNLQEGTSE